MAQKSRGHQEDPLQPQQGKSSQDQGNGALGSDSRDTLIMAILAIPLGLTVTNFSVKQVG